jgi:hypothetical protein
VELSEAGTLCAYRFLVPRAVQEPRFPPPHGFELGSGARVFAAARFGAWLDEPFIVNLIHQGAVAGREPLLLLPTLCAFLCLLLTSGCVGGFGSAFSLKSSSCSAGV